jgi:hypothetical protein
VQVPMVFRGGCSLVFSLGDLDRVEYVILKNIKSFDRFSRQQAYMSGENDQGAIPVSSLYADQRHGATLDFNLLHRTGA